MIGYASSLVPQYDHYGIVAMLLFEIWSLFANTGVKFNIEEVINSQPSDNTIQRFVEQNAVNTMILTRDNIQNSPNIYVSADKGNKKGNKNLSKFVCCWYATGEEEVIFFLLDVDCTDDHTENIDDELTHSLQILLLEELHIL